MGGASCRTGGMNVLVSRSPITPQKESEGSAHPNLINGHWSP